MVNKYNLIILISFIWVGITKAQITDISKNNWKLWLDESALYWNDIPLLPPVDLSKVTLNEPTCGWENLYDGRGKDITLPATVEEYFWGDNGNAFGLAGDYVGVSWFTTDFDVPENWQGKRVQLKFESVRLRAEIFVNKTLVAYDLLSGTHFEVDISNAVKYGAKNKLAVRITDPEGNFLWIDFKAYKWGDKKIPPSHGFGGIPGKVEIEVTDAIYLADVFVQNTSELNVIIPQVTIASTQTKAINGEVKFEVTAWKSNKVLFEKTVKTSTTDSKLVITEKIDLPDAKLWSPDTPNLYLLKTQWKGTDGSSHEITKRFGFRWFEPKTVDGERMLFLNNKRIVLRTSISWGFWPVNGIYPTEELAQKQIQVAKDLGLNMLNFHRGIGQTLLLDLADEMGLLYYEEPGGYKTGKEDVFVQDWNRTRFLRMMERDRSHPSLIIYNMINESNQDPLPHEIDDIKLFHEKDPTRLITFTSTNLFKKGSYGGINPAYVEAGIKMHMLPNDTTRYYSGWWDQHFPDGSGVYLSNFYNSPTDMHKGSDNKTEIVMWGEDGAIGSPHRLELIKNEIERGHLKGWDSDSYMSQFNAYDKFLDDKGFRKVFPSVDDLCLSLGANPMYYQARIIENIRVNNNVDCYVVNGWEGEKVENHSGVVDIYRNPKGDPDIMAHYNQPLYVAIKARNLVFETGYSTLVDFYIVNELNLKGNYKLQVIASDTNGEFFNKAYKVKLIGGNTYGQLLVEGVEIKPTTKGHAKIEAKLLKTEASGFETVYTNALDNPLTVTNIAVLDSTGQIDKMLKAIGIDTAEYIHNWVPEKCNCLLLHQASGKFGQSSMHVRDEMLEWVKRGNTLIVTREADKFCENFLQYKEIVDYRGSRIVRKNWFGGNYIVKAHELFEGLPVNTAFNWEYQCLADYKKQRYGLRVGNGETVVAVSADHKAEMYSSVVVLPVGRGKIILSTLDLEKAILQNDASSIVAKKLFQNYIKYAQKPIKFQ